MTVRVSFPQPERSIVVEEGTLLLDAVRRAGLPIASACGADGICGRCGVAVLAGADTLPEEGRAERDAKQRNRIDPAQRLACRIRVTADLAVTATYW